jgi:hypothetical protein
MSQSRKSQEERLSTLFKYFVDVVRINIFITTSSGKSIVTPDRNRYGWNLLVDVSQIKTQFKDCGSFLEYVDPFEFHHFAIPIKSGYVVLGPLAINKKLDRTKYEEIALKITRNPDDILDSIEEIRVVSQNQLKSILDLITEAKDFFINEDEPVDIGAVETLNTALKTLLEVALTMTKAQSGSIMLYQEPRGLTVQVSKGINPQFIHKPTQLGEGISGYALKEKQTLVLTDKSDNRISHLLKRKDIKQSIVMPFENEGKQIRGVLNLNIQESDSFLKGMDYILQNLEQITRQAIQNLA